MMKPKYSLRVFGSSLAIFASLTLSGCSGSGPLGIFPIVLDSYAVSKDISESLSLSAASLTIDDEPIVSCPAMIGRVGDSWVCNATVIGLDINVSVEITSADGDYYLRVLD